MTENKNNSKEVAKILKRNCVICGKKLIISVYKDRKYKGGEYFGKVLPEKIEYWECRKCYKDSAKSVV